MRLREKLLPATRRFPVHRELAHLPGAVEPTLNVACPPAGEISHRQGEKFSAKKIENRRIEPHRGESEQIFLRQGRELHEDERREHPEQNGLQQPEIVFHDDPVHDHLREHGEDQLKEADGHGKPEDLEQDDFEPGQERNQPSQGSFAFGSLFECVV